MSEIFLSIFFLPIFTFGYNLDLQNPIIYGANTNSGGLDETIGKSYFGYSVVLHAKDHNSINGSTVHESWIIVGAPKANYSRHPDHGNKIPIEPGVAYRCPLKGNCVPINVKNPDDEVGAIKEVKLNTLIEKGHGWFGASLSLHDDADLLTICAPRTIVRIYYSNAIEYQNTMHGVCYNGSLTSGDLDIQDKNFEDYDFSSNFWYNPLNGFSVVYPPWQTKMQPGLLNPIIGSPKHELYGSVRKMGRRKHTELPLSDDLTQFGYALASGHFFSEDELLVAGSAPGWQYVGRVAIMQTRMEPFQIVTTVEGTQVGEYFGGSLATGDLNKDGFDDLIVGSPHWKNDNGRVKIFFGNKAELFESTMTLEGNVVDALYGYAVTSGDLDGDGYDDLVVGAPWEESGVIYVYNGGAKIHELSMIEPSQRIEGSVIKPSIQRFGFSLAKPVDMDGNGFADLGVGAYASGHAVVLLSRPVLKTELTLSLFPSALPQNASSFILEVCVENFIKNKPSMWAFECLASVDEDYQRVVYKTSHTMILTWKRPPHGKACDNTTFTLLKGKSNFIDVIDIVVTHRLLNNTYESQGHRSQCELCPIEYKGAHLTTARTKLAFDIGCGMDDVCQSFIFAMLSFVNITNSTWVIGSDDLSLELLVGNHAEPAYFTTATFYIPNGITLRSISPMCQEDNDGETFLVTCDVGNPLGKAMAKKVILDLDMNRMHNGSTHGIPLDFRVDIKTRSVNSGIRSMAKALHRIANLSVALSGKAYDNSYYFNYNNEKVSNVTVQHTYQISRLGVTPIYEARLSIRIPYKIGDLEYLSIGNVPRISILGRSYECSVSNVSISAHRVITDKTANRRKSQKMITLNEFANNTRNRRTTKENAPILDEKNQTNVSVETITNENTMHADRYRSMPEFINAPEIHLNCSTPNIKCGLVVCNVAHLKTSQDVAKIQLKFVIDNSKLTDESEENGKIIRFSSEAWLDVVNPAMPFVVSGTGIVIPVTTTFHLVRKVKSVSIWIILGSILLGLLALIVLALVLKRIGFFERKRKGETDISKSNDAIPLECELISDNE